MKASLCARCVDAVEIADTHGSPPDERGRRGVSDAMLRPSTGLEDAADLNQALG